MPARRAGPARRRTPRRRRRATSRLQLAEAGGHGWIRLRAAATTSRGAVAGSASRRKSASRRPTVSGRGDSRSCGSVSQLREDGDGRTPSMSATAPPEVLGLPAVAVTPSTVRAGAVPRRPRRGECGSHERPQRRGPSTANAGFTGGGHVAGRGSEGAEFGVGESPEQTGKLGHGSPCHHQRTAQRTPTPERTGARPHATRADSPASRGGVTGRKHAKRAAATPASFTSSRLTNR